VITGIIASFPRNPPERILRENKGVYMGFGSYNREPTKKAIAAAPGCVLYTE